jgi:hypothetical protein
MSNPAESSNINAPSPEIQPVKSSRGLACIFCQQRKVKCDRQNPCASCTKARVTCTYRTRRAPRRHQSRATEVSLRARLGRLEELLKTAVARNEELETDQLEDDDTSQPPVNEPTALANALNKSLSLQEWMTKLESAKEPQTSPAKSSRWDVGPFTQGQMFAEQGKSRYIEKQVIHSLLNSY